jgi:DnaJ like chaperone protein
LFDRPPREFFGVPMSEKEIKNSVFFVAAFSMLGKLAKADGRVSDEETEAVKSIVTNKFRLSHQSAAFAFKTFADSIEDDEPFETHAAAFYSQFSEAPEALISMLEFLLIVAHADFDYDASEEALIKGAAEMFKLSGEYETILALYSAEPDNLVHCYQFLNSSTDDNAEVIHERYQHLMTEHDPVRLLAEGVPKELIAIAEEKIVKIENAYTHIMTSREAEESSHDG